MFKNIYGEVTSAPTQERIMLKSSSFNFAVKVVDGVLNIGVGDSLRLATLGGNYYQCKINGRSCVGIVSAVIS